MSKTIKDLRKNESFCLSGKKSKLIVEKVLHNGVIAKNVKSVMCFYHSSEKIKN